MTRCVSRKVIISAHGRLIFWSMKGDTPSPRLFKGGDGNSIYNYQYLPDKWTLRRRLFKEIYHLTTSYGSMMFSEFIATPVK